MGGVSTAIKKVPFLIALLNVETHIQSAQGLATHRAGIGWGFSGRVFLLIEHCHAASLFFESGLSPHTL